MTGRDLTDSEILAILESVKTGSMKLFNIIEFAREIIAANDFTRAHGEPEEKENGNENIS